jgi:hypothetical protein
MQRRAPWPGEKVTDYGRFTDARLKHLELIQAVIARLGGNGFLIKGWAVTVGGIFFGFAVSSRDPLLAAASVLPTLAFWMLDAYFLRCERLFRELYDRVRKEDPVIEAFFMSATSPAFAASTNVASPARVLFSGTLRGFYLMLLAAAFVVGVVAAISGAAGSAVAGDKSTGLLPRAGITNEIAQPLAPRVAHRLFGGPNTINAIVAPPRNNVKVQVKHRLLGGRS